jgi:acetyl-CoA acetyltransferase family protein
VAEVVALREAIAGSVKDGDSVALEGFTHLIPTAAGHEIIRRFVNPKMEKMGHTDSLGLTAENLACERYHLISAEEHRPQELADTYDISRETQDRFALHSHQKAIAAMDEKRFREEIVALTVQGRKGARVVEAEEGPRRDTSLEKLGKLKPAFKEDGSVTAGNSSSLNDGGAAAVLVVCKQYAQAHALEPVAKIRSVGVAGVPPRVMGIGPVPATNKALQRAGITLEEVGLIELNEAFAAQSLAVLCYTSGVWTQRTRG